jgi:hypothetical protein
MPTRLLEITLGKNDRYAVRLCKTTGQSLVYAALSYIWGGPQSCQTLKRNIDEYLQHIELQKVPKTILDAIHCTQTLGLKYLWVDSLCIIQDSAEDKSREIGLMSTIYKNAYVTISAAKATSCEEGFLEPRTSVENLLQNSFKLEILTPKDPIALSQWAEAHRLKDDFSNLLSTLETEDLFKASEWNHPDAWYKNPSTVRLAATPLGDSDEEDFLTAGDIEAEPISKRGWTLQESWLSRRMLIYGSRQLLWTCYAGVQVDGGLTGSNLAWGHKNIIRANEMGEMVDFNGNRVSEDERMVILGKVWRDIVQQSSRRALTVAGDKLNALDGIVQELRRQAGGEYLAGLWKQRLVSELSWYQDSTHNGWESMLCNTERTCPSWSWISTDGPVSFSYAGNSRVMVEDAKIVRSKLIGEYPNSRLVVDGTITLRAPMSTLPIAQSLPYFTFPTGDMSRLAFTNVIFPDGALTNPEFTIQTVNGEPQIVAPDDLRFLELSWGKEEGSQNMASESRGLALVPVQSEDGRKDVFQRIGYFIVALEQGLDMEGLVYSASAEPGNVMPTEFGKLWRNNLREERVLII